MSTKKAAIYDPYFDTLGGGERYTSSFAKLLEDKGYKVDFWWPTDMKSEIASRFSIDLKTSNFVHFFPNKHSFFSRLMFTSKYDLLFWVSDGSIPLSLSKKTIIHFQVPFHDKACGSFANRVKIQPYKIVSNSKFTKSFIDKTYGVRSKVIYPPVEVNMFTPGPKKDLIVSIGRIANILHAKRQDVLIKAFSLLSSQLPNYRLVIAGGAQDKEYIAKLNKLAQKLPVEIIPNPSLETIRKLLSQAKFFWSATGFEVDPKLNPEKVEHFGIAVVEAMAAGSVPLVIKAGGHLETVENNVNGVYWSTVDELASSTIHLAKSPKLTADYSQSAIIRSKLFSRDIFNQEFSKLL